MALLAVFAVALFAPAGSDAHHDESVEHADHGGSCPDGDEQPCPDGCNCMCCPGHLRALIVADGELDRFDRKQPLPVPAPLGLLDGIFDRVFHPPRTV